MTEPSHAVFLSYASQDAEAAQRICEALQAGEIEVWFDQSELRGGDAWDQSIRKQIKTCALFLPIISRTTHDRREGYFRLEWKLAVDRCHLMDADLAFLLPIVIDDTCDDDERVPERFREVQWTRLPGGVTPAPFVERVRRLLSGEPARDSTKTASAATHGSAVPAIRKRALPLWRSKAALLISIAVALGVLGYLVAHRLIPLKRGSEVAPVIAFAPPPHSIAVLPFVNLSGDKEQEYFSDGLTEELLNSLAQINELQVAARTSSFSFKENPDIATVAHKLNVGAVLEGSVRRSASTIRITVQLINAVTGFHLWSKTYDRNLGDVLKLQTEIATQVAGALKVTLLGDLAAKVELGGTRNPAAFDAYLRGWKVPAGGHNEQYDLTAIAAYTEAIGLDQNYALAFAHRSIALNGYAGITSGPAIRESYDKALADARKAIVLTPDLAEGHLALAYHFESGALDFAQASAEYDRALALAPGNAQVLQRYGLFAVRMGRTEAGIVAARRAVVLDPLSSTTHSALGAALFSARRYSEAISTYQHVLALEPENPDTYAYRGIAYYVLGDFDRARAACESKADYGGGQICLALVYGKLGRLADAQSMLAKFQASDASDAAAYQYAEIYAQWGNAPKALAWLDTAVRLRDPGLVDLKTDPLMDPLRQERRFQAIMRELKFPN
jgi:TolB-like protein/Flp pilus assembly protein TadD